MVVQNVFGWLSFILGVLMIISFPSVRQYTPDKFSNLGIIAGIFLIVLGLFLIKS